MIRRALVDIHTASKSAGIYFGRFIVPLGFGWQEMGSWTTQDATLIQRLNAEASFGAGLYGVVRRQGRDVAARRGSAQ